MSFRGRGRGRGGRGGYSAFGRDTQNSMDTDAQLTEITIKDWTGGTLDDLLQFIHRKSGVTLRNARVAPNKIMHAYCLPDEVRSVESYNGIRFAGSSLSIRVMSPQTSSATTSTIGELTNFLKQRYNPQAKLLALTAMLDDPIIRNLGSFTATKMFDALIKIAKDEVKYDVESVDLSNNNLQDVAAVSSLALQYPNLKNLCLSNNVIARTSVFENWRHKFPRLRELILQGNPVTNQPNYKEDIMKYFQRLVILDGITIRDESQLAVPRLPHLMKKDFFENPDVQGVANSFLASYFELYDSNRSQLLQLYDEMSLFSVSVDNAAPRVLMGATPSWTNYIPLSRNLTKVTSGNTRQSRLYLGTQSIANTFQRLPVTKHNFTSPGKFSVDVWRTSNVRAAGDTAISIAIHGEFNESQNMNALRSFDRTFVLLPGPNSMIVASDMLNLRAYSGEDGWKESAASAAGGGAVAAPGATTNNVAAPNAAFPSATGAAPGGGVVPTPSPTGVPPQLNGLSPDQLTFVQNLMRATSLNAQYARVCAEQAQFNEQQAMSLFEQSKGAGNLPPDAFQ